VTDTPNPDPVFVPTGAGPVTGVPELPPDPDDPDDHIMLSADLVGDGSRALWTCSCGRTGYATRTSPNANIKKRAREGHASHRRNATRPSRRGTYR
jgi:hypothetical protein